MNNEQLQSIYLYESGKPEVFNNAGNKNLVELGNASKYLILSAVMTNNQLQLQKDINNFRISLLNDPELSKLFTSTYSLSDFHAYNDYPIIKTKFLEFISKLDNISIEVLVVNKLSMPLILQQNPNRMYGTVAGFLLRDILNCNSEIIFSRKDTKLRLQKEIEIEVEKLRISFTNDNNSRDVKVNYLHNPHHTHGGLQVADYVAHAVFQHFENQKPDQLLLIKSKIVNLRVLNISSKK
jgi:hypothetical protein